MKTLKFQPLRESRQECYNVEDYELLDFDFEGNKKRVYSNVNLSIFTDDYCNADCKFCVAQLRFENKGLMYKKCKINNDEEYFKRLDYVLNYLRPLNPSVSITGGEPTKSKRLPEILRIIDKYNYRKRTLTTNGSGLLDEMEGKTVIQHIVDNKFSHLNISKAHFDDDINKKIMKYETGYCSNEMLETIVSYAKANNLRPRMSCVLLKEGIATLDDMINYMNFYQSIGLDNIIFRELMDYNKDTMTNISKIKYCIDNKVRLNDVWKLIDTDDRFTPIRNLLGYYYYVEVYKYQNIDMCSEGANLVKLYDEKEKHKDMVYEMVFHPNGNLNGSWVDNEDILLKYISE
jgi:molybdenum cofactor biosynthesis enzyme MoaA